MIAQIGTPSVKEAAISHANEFSERTYQNFSMFIHTSVHASEQ
jgi:hypothetical protein